MIAVPSNLEGHGLGLARTELLLREAEGDDLKTITVPAQLVLGEASEQPCVTTWQALLPSLSYRPFSEGVKSNLPSETSRQLW